MIMSYHTTLSMILLYLIYEDLETQNSLFHTNSGVSRILKWFCYGFNGYLLGWHLWMNNDIHQRDLIKLLKESCVSRQELLRPDPQNQHIMQTKQTCIHLGNSDLTVGGQEGVLINQVTPENKSPCVHRTKHYYLILNLRLDFKEVHYWITQLNFPATTMPQLSSFDWGINDRYKPAKSI